jgi:hypothetical protein
MEAKEREQEQEAATRERLLRVEMEAKEREQEREAALRERLLRVEMESKDREHERKLQHDQEEAAIKREHNFQMENERLRSGCFSTTEVGNILWSTAKGE